MATFKNWWWCAGYCQKLTWIRFMEAVILKIMTSFCIVHVCMYVSYNAHFRNVPSKKCCWQSILILLYRLILLYKSRSLICIYLFDNFWIVYGCCLCRLLICACIWWKRHLRWRQVTLAQSSSGPTNWPRFQRRPSWLSDFICWACSLRSADYSVEMNEKLSNYSQGQESVLRGKNLCCP